MGNIFFNRKYQLVLVILISALSYYLFINAVKYVEPNKIFEINNTQSVYYNPETKIVTTEKHYMITKPPEGLHELKVLVERFMEENPVNIKMIESEVKKTRNITVNQINKIVFFIYFYRESSEFPRNWQPKEGRLTTDRIEHHKEDLIALIVWSDLDQNKEYSLMKKNKEGDTIEEIIFIDDKIVEHTFD